MCPPVTELVGPAKSGVVNAVNIGRTLRLEVSVTCQGHMAGLAPVVELHAGSMSAAAVSGTGSNPLSSGAMSERDG